VNWTDEAQTLDRRVRALNPWPGVWCEKGGERLLILSAAPAEGKGKPGEVIGAPLIVACGNGALRLDRVQRAGKSAMSAEEYVRGNPVSLGTLLE
jgi:methionyl-tRNA formyltransferase